jgi:hypothetical protein
VNLFTEAQAFLNANFKGLQLKQPLFYQQYPALRFDLQDENLHTTNANYFEEVLRRMQRIHELTTSDQDDILILYKKLTYRRSKIRKRSYLFKQFNLHTATFQLKRKPYPLYAEEGNSSAYKSCQLILKDKAGNINFSGLYLGIAHMDFNRKPVIYGEVYILNLTRQTITQMYDDRGCDVVATDISLLQGYYNQLSDLILEWDRAEMIKRLKLETE